MSERFDNIAVEVEAKLGKDHNVEAVEITKENGVVFNGIRIWKEGSSVAPVIYFNPEDSDEKIIENVLITYGKAENPVFEMDNFTKWDFVKTKIVPVLYNKKMNNYSDLVTKNFCDELGIYYRVILSTDEGGMSSTKVNKELLEKWGTTKETLHRYAMKNLNNIITIEHVMDVINNYGISSSTRTINMENKFEYGMFVATTTTKTNGASAILLIPELIKNGEIEDKDYTIIPSSIHECLLVECDMPADHLKAMIGNVNGSMVKPEEILSGYPFIYRAAEKKFEKLVA